MSARRPRPAARATRAEAPLDSARRMARLDPQGMGDRIEGLASQIRAGAAIAEPLLDRVAARRPRRAVLFGMGGSAIAGDLIRSLVDREGTAPVHVVRHYEPPEWITPEDFLIFSSYSGETEETVTAYRTLRRVAAPSCVISTGGTLARLADEDGVPRAVLPGGFPPRAALGYSASTLLHLCSHLLLVGDAPARLDAAVRGLEEVASACGRHVLQSRNPAKQLALRLAGRAVIVLSNERTLGPVALRWKGQLNENAKHLAWASPLPEMNHNEVDGYVAPRSVVTQVAAVLLRDPADHPRVAARFDWLEAYLARKRVQVDTVEVRGQDVMARLLSGAAIGDWVSYYLALAHGHDPSALPGVESLKRAMSG
ncbi:MAG TPA: bifunctional phosphoglucose/phosphomannose isomerase [Candidatus Eisenbacteria bacterium]|nr:bifunctional phosphoglucose/phosphomannose isomerase [Candidatus Eisenbacteria bacterium]